MKIKVTRSYQITIPAEIREKLGIKVGDTLTISLKEDHIVIEKPRTILPSIKLGQKVSTQDVERLIEEALEEIAG